MDGSIESGLTSLGAAKVRKEPDYLVETYSWAYLHPISPKILDNPLVMTAILWGNLPRLVRYACSEFEPGQRILQAASTYGPLSPRLAATVGSNGFLDVVDISPLQVLHCRRKLAAYRHTRVRLGDAATLGGRTYDGICCFFLLHEVPDDYKQAVVGSLLASVRPGGKVVFVDYHKPSRFHPLRPLMHLVFRWLEPFAFGLLDREITDFAADAQSFAWHKQTYFGGLYQKVVGVRTSL
jgi:SAM-dependent methyltransferase